MYEVRVRTHHSYRSSGAKFLESEFFFFLFSCLSSCLLRFVSRDLRYRAVFGINLEAVDWVRVFSTLVFFHMERVALLGK